MLGEDLFLVEDVLDLYHGRGAFEGVLVDENVEAGPDRWCSPTACGQELWQIACQWVRYSGANGHSPLLGGPCRFARARRSPILWQKHRAGLPFD